jgi:hypothetical protein
MKQSANKAPMQIPEGSWLAQTHQRGAKGLLNGKGKALLNLSLQSDTHAGLLRDRDEVCYEKLQIGSMQTTIWLQHQHTWSCRSHIKLCLSPSLSQKAISLQGLPQGTTLYTSHWMISGNVSLDCIVHSFLYFALVYQKADVQVPAATASNSQAQSAETLHTKGKITRARVTSIPRGLRTREERR